LHVDTDVIHVPLFGSHVAFAGGQSLFVTYSQSAGSESAHALHESPLPGGVDGHCAT
jgi:hypothetical protein